MTMVVGAKFEEGIIVLSDSRVTLLHPISLEECAHHDAAQKLFPLTKNIVIGFAGSFNSFMKIASAIRNRISKKDKLQHINILSQKLQKILEEEFKRIIKSNPISPDVEIIIAGYTKTQKPKAKMWVFKSLSNFQAIEVSDSFHVIGSGEIVTSFIQDNWDKIKKINTIKRKADWFILHLESQLNKEQISNVGGLFQVLLIKEDAVYPIHYGSYLTDPYVQYDAYEMKVDKGVWTQTNKSTGEKKALVAPHHVPLNLKSSKIKDFKHQDNSRTSVPHIHYFISSARYEQQPGVIDFTPVYNMLAPSMYPYEIHLLLNLGFRVPTGKHLIEFYYCKDADLTGQKILETEWESDAPILDQDVGIELDFTARKPGVYFFEIYINKILVGNLI